MAVLVRQGLDIVTAEFSPATKDAVRARSGSVCEVCGAASAVTFHHRRSRSMGSTKRPESAAPSNCLHVCDFGGCHNLIEKHRNLATLLGWLVPSTFNPASQPVLYRGDWARLGEDGSVEFERRAA